ncbi:MAG: Na+/H+ antiporter subunit E [Myxococcales bacterium]
MSARRNEGGPIFLAVSFALSLGAWILFVGKIGWNELLAGAFASALAATAAHMVWAQHIAGFRGNLGWLLEMWRLPIYAVTGTGEIFAVLFRQVLGRKPAESLILAVSFDAGGDDDESAARRALVVAYTTSTPNFVVIGVDRKRGHLVYHQIKRSPVLQISKDLGARP